MGVITWRQTTNYSLQSGCGQYRIAKAKCGHDLYKYVAYAKIDDKWQLISKALDSADDAKNEVEQWCQHNKKN